MSSLNSDQRLSLCALLDTFLPSLDEAEVSKIINELPSSSDAIFRREAIEKVLRSSATTLGVADAYVELLEKG